MSDIYTLSPFQQERLEMAAQGRLSRCTTAIAFASRDDTPVLVERLEDQRQAMRELVEIGLLIDVSHKHSRKIAEHQRSKGRRYGVWMLTLDALRMFSESEYSLKN